MANPDYPDVGIGAIRTQGKIGGIRISEYAGTPENNVIGDRKGDLCIDYTNGAIYVFTGTAGAKTTWKLVTQAA